MKGVNSQLTVRTIKGKKLLDIKDLNGLAFMTLKSEIPVQLPTKFINKELSTSKNLPKPELTHRWKHLRSIAKHLPLQLLNVRIDLLIS